MPRPTLVFDGDCSFCAIWVNYWRSLTGDRVDYLPGQKDEIRDAVQFVTPDGTTSGAEAVFNLLAGVPGYGWMLWLYRAAPGFALLADWWYGIVARHRNAAYRVTRVLWGGRIERPVYHRAADVFSRSLSFIYLIAFASFGMQARGLIGSQGILPVNTYFRLAKTQLGGAAYWRVPTLFWWTHSDFALLSIAWGGVALAAISILARPHSRWQRMIFVILFVYYLSIVSAGQIFMSYQWDLLLLETGFLAIFLLPVRPRVWLFRWLLFRLMFESGLVKLMSHDPSWSSLTAMAVHYETQPLPTVLAWYAHQLPLWFQKASTAMVFVVELGLPLLMWGPRRLRHIAGCGTIGLQLLIFATGNYTFFNLLAIALCLFLFDDTFLSFGRGASATRAAEPKPWRFASAVLVVCIGTLSCVEFAAPAPMAAVIDAVAPFGIVNQYGLFAVMTTKRIEVEVEGSNDGQVWLPYVFPWKAGPLNRAPGWVAPFQPRLDWQMWFAALGNFQQNPWFVRFAITLLEGSKPVLALIDRDPFGGKPPAQIRAMIYEYHFTTFEEKRRTGSWWKRESAGTYFPPVGLRK